MSGKTPGRYEGVHMPRVSRALPLAAVLALAFAGTAQAHRATCRETTNPHGQNTPPAGHTTSPGTNPRSGQNDDGFYVLGTNTGRDTIRVLDDGSGTVFGPFAVGTKIKYTQRPGGKPEQKKIGSSNGQSGAVTWHIFGTGDAFAFSSDGVKVPCRVSPPPR